LGCRLRDLFRPGCISQFIPFPGLADIPVLAKTAPKIAASRSKGKDCSSWQEMVQRLFLDRIDTESATSAISSQNHFITQSLPDETETALSFVQFTKTRTELAFNAAVRQHSPPSTGIIGLAG
jgi:hypothetical protein